MKKLTRKLFISVLVAVFAFVALGTSTYAWITISTTAEVNAFQAQVDAGEAGIELSETGDEGTWTSVLTLEEQFAKPSDPTFNSYKLDDLTTKDGITFYNFVSDVEDGKNIMKVAENDVLTDADGNPIQYNKTQGYIEYTIKMRRSSQSAGSTNVRVNGAKVVFTADAGEAAATFQYGETTEVKNLYATNALRLSVTGNKGTVIYEQNASTNSNTIGVDKTGGYAHKYAAFQGIELKNDTYGEYTTLKAETTASSDPIIINLTNQQVENVTFRIWIEGWDNECHSKILTQSFKVQFGFEIVGE